MEFVAEILKKQTTFLWCTGKAQELEAQIDLNWKNGRFAISSGNKVLKYLFNYKLKCFFTLNQI